jgi:hypothetical protein
MRDTARRVVDREVIALALLHGGDPRKFRLKHTVHCAVHWYHHPNLLIRGLLLAWIPLYNDTGRSARSQAQRAFEKCVPHNATIFLAYWKTLDCTQTVWQVMSYMSFHSITYSAAATRIELYFLKSPTQIFTKFYNNPKQTSISIRHERDRP